METELQILWAAVVAYVVGGTLAVVTLVLGKRRERTILGLIACGLGLQTLSIALRWERLGHGPFITMFEILCSNVWSLMLAYLIAYWRIPRIRGSAAVVMPLMFIMLGWLMLAHPGEGHFPPTYTTPWLFIHIGLGKVFLGAVLVAVGLSCVILLRRAGIGVSRFQQLPPDRQLDELAFRCMAIGLIFHTLMLIAGAIWAQDAWGRYWAWDPLETWAFITWLTVAFTLHARVTFRVSPQAHATMILMVFVTAFLTFFGVPFISQAAHQGAI
ncbi:MAG TPA: cytochrome c biogenesis protein CcsA [Aromatoleum sp.]|uniref:cytochrome c biogenesis protein CcsA n=1 Tax=Aromatoleum sp. TaxID=2307007 RepID=UPI002B4644C8|nr:cytochrome c biogenesis protein CcsA [Aromatoleum sp.]HJV25462.1 cytochrome c biogenesis protein CcsA [Aromatoleum sp.]